MKVYWRLLDRFPVIYLINRRGYRETEKHTLLKTIPRLLSMTGQGSSHSLRVVLYTSCGYGMKRTMASQRTAVGSLRHVVNACRVRKKSNDAIEVGNATGHWPLTSTAIYWPRAGNSVVTQRSVRIATLSVCLSVCLSVTRRYCVKTAKRIVILFHCWVATPF